eukprot:NODE_3240_length_1253_cov_32.122124_g3076_i0.p1 GENE.NODE_3240_length_1253_cov_32.122124_g3076_i0~~NODE_3240_length_1253_cov_32.122124_g3076_i0.p1  ORF type:complete len:299 (+),score=70.13 NODE_3240_length_1253_cov_32.122124_g3076_i0:178-1074(+)
MDESTLSQDALEGAISILPMPEDLKAIAQVKENPEELATMSLPVRFFAMTTRIPRIGPRLSCWMMKMKWPALCTHVREEIEAVKVGATALRSCKSFQAVLRSILNIGNVLNEGARDVSGARGFKMEDLARLKDLKSVDNTSTLLEFLVEHLTKKDPRLLLFPKELTCLKRARTVNVTEIGTSLGSMQHELTQLGAQLRVFGNSNPDPADRFAEVMGPFKDQAEEDLRDLEDRLGKLKQQLQDLGKYFGEPPKFDPQDFFGGLVTFCSQFTEAKHKYESQRVVVESEPLNESRRMRSPG